MDCATPETMATVKAGNTTATSMAGAAVNQNLSTVGWAERTTSHSNKVVVRMVPEKMVDDTAWTKFHPRRLPVAKIRGHGRLVS